jgi:hypothetical protein
MDIHTAARLHLLNYPGIQSKVGSRIYWLRLPDSPTYPAISYFRVSNAGEHLVNTYSPRFQFDVWVKTAGEALDIAELIRKAFQRFKGIMGGAGGKKINQGVHEDTREMYEPDTGLYHTSVDVFFHYIEP